MKKRLLLQLLAVMFAVGTYASDYIYTRTAKFKITGDNLVTNGSFNEGDGWGSQWLSETNTKPEGTVWGINTNLAGPNGENTAISLSASTAEGTLLTNMWTVEAGKTYAVSYWVKAPAATTCTTTRGGSNYLQFMLSADGSTTDSISVSDAATFLTEWSQVTTTFTVEDATKTLLLLYIGNMISGTEFTNFAIYPVEQVYDTRNIDRLREYIERLRADENLPESKDILDEQLDEIDNAMSNPATFESEDAMGSLIENVEDAIQEFIDDNSGDTRSGDWSTRGSAGWNKLNNATVSGSWATIGSRWGFSPNDESLGRPAEDGYVLTGGIQKGMDLGAVGVQVTRTDGILPAGKYFFSIEAQAVAVDAKNYDDNYKPYNYASVITGPSIWVGTDTLVMRPANDVELANTASNKKYAEKADTLSGDYWKKYYYIAEITQDTLLNAGFLFPAGAAGTGGVRSLRNPQFRLIGTTSVQLSYDLDIRDVKTQQGELKARIEAYPTDVAELPWGKDSLDIAIKNAQELLNATYGQFVDADGNVLIEPTQANVALMEDQYDFAGNVTQQGIVNQLKAQVTAMNRAKSWIQNRNAIQQTMKDVLAAANESKDADSHKAATAATRSAFESAINAGQALVDAVATINSIEGTNAKYEEFEAAILQVKMKRLDFEVTVATRANPAEIYQVQNPCFEAWTGNKNYGSTTTENGWNFIKPSGSGIDYLKLTVDNSAFESGKGIGGWRGSSVTMDAKVQQAFTLTHKGLYEYRAKAQAADDLFGDMAGHTEILNLRVLVYNEEDEEWDYEVTPIDTIYSPDARLFFGYDGRPDSISIYKGIGVGGSNSTATTNTWYGINQRTPWSYSTFYLKTKDEDEPAEIGFENVGGGAINGWGFGDSHVYYVGDVDAYLTALKADIAADSVKARGYAKELEAAENAASVQKRSKAQNSAWFIVDKLDRFIRNGLESTIQAKMTAAGVTKADDQKVFTIKELQNAWLSINEMANLIQLRTTDRLNDTAGISEISSDNNTAPKTTRGIFTISGVKVQGDLKSLPRGLYIINGKKYVIK